MPDYPQEAFTAAAGAVMERLAGSSGRSREWGESIVRDALDAAAAVLAELSEPPGVYRGLPNLLSRREFHDVMHVLVTISTDDDDHIHLEYMPEDAYLRWSAKEKRRRAKGGKQ